MNNRGSITIFLALLLPCILLLICSLVESARIISSRTQAQEYAYMAADANFSQYAKEVFEEYGIFGLWETIEEAEKDFSYFFSKSTKNTKDLTGVSLMDCKAEGILYLTDNHGELFAGQVDRLMQYKMRQDLVQGIWDHISGIQSNKKMSTFLNKMSGCMDAVETLENCVGTIHDQVESVREIIQETTELQDEINLKLQEIRNCAGKKSERTQQQYLYEEKAQMLDACLDELQDIMRKQEDYGKLYSTYAQTAGNITGTLEAALHDSEEEFGKEIYQSLDQYIQELNSQISGKADYYNVYQCLEKREEIGSYIEQLHAGIESIQKAMDEEDYSELPEFKVSIPNLQNYVINYSVETVKKVKKSIVTIIRDLIDDGVLGLIITEDMTVSEKKEEIQQLPSRTVQYEKNYEYRNMISDSEIVRKIRFSQYILDYFSDYGNQDEEDSLQYQVEYILEGKDNDKKNLEKVAEEIICIREGFNLAYLLTDREKCAEAEWMAAGLVGITGVTPLITITKIMILGVWATAESIIDVRLLLQGKSVPLVKTRKTWNTTLSDLAGFHTEHYDGQEVQVGFDYQDYLRVLLLNQNKVTQVYRAMDIIEMEMQKRYNENFQMQDCICRITYVYTCQVKQLLCGLPFGKKKYRYQTQCIYTY